MKMYLLVLMLFLFVLNKASYGTDSTMVKPLRNEVQPKVLKAYVDTGDCQPTNEKKWLTFFNIGGGDTSQVCPPHHPVLYAHQQKAVYLSQSAWGTTTASCCAIKHRWEDA
jgi:hypothetical protein